MRKMSLERRITCAQDGRVSDLQMAEKILREAAELPLKDYLEGEPELYKYVLLQLGKERDILGLCVTLQDIEEHENKFNFMTYSQACRKLISDYEDGRDIKDQLIVAFAYTYRKEVEQKKEDGIPVFTVLNSINMKEYFEALSQITGDERDAVIPREICAYSDWNIEELLYNQCNTFHKVLESICAVLIEPFAKIDGVLKKEKEQWDCEDEVPWEEYEQPEEL